MRWQLWPCSVLSVLTWVASYYLTLIWRRDKVWRGGWAGACPRCPLASPGGQAQGPHIRSTPLLVPTQLFYGFFGVRDEQAEETSQGVEYEVIDDDGDEG